MSEMFEGHKPSELGVELDLRYATANNICGRPLYRSGEKVWLHRRAMDLLVKAASDAVGEDYKLLVFDAYRPQRVQEALWAQCQDVRYVANPKKGSLHTRGIAVDVSLVYRDVLQPKMTAGLDTAEWVSLDMGTDFDEMSESAHWDAFEKGLISPKQHGNRVALRKIMAAAGFETIPTEWWHYQLSGVKGDAYPLIREDAEASLTHPDLRDEAP